MAEGLPLDFIREAWPTTLAELPRPKWLEQTAVVIVFELGRQYQLRRANQAAGERIKSKRSKRKPGRPARRGESYAKHVLKDLGDDEQASPWDPQ